MNRRLANLLSVRLEDARLDEVRDDRDPRGKRWDLGVLLRAAIVGIASGAKSLADTEEVTASLSRAMRRKLGVARRVPDTTLRDNPAQWMLLIRRHWGVETTHQTLDVAFEDDDHPWIEQNPRGMLVVAILRRIAYTLLALFRGVTQRSGERRAMPWKLLLRNIHTALLVTTDVDLARLRLRASSP